MVKVLNKDLNKRSVIMIYVIMFIIQSAHIIRFNY